MLQCEFHYQKDAFSLDAAVQMQNSVLGIVGPSGAGKTTFLKLLLGLYKPQSGYIHLNKQILTDTDQKIHIPIHQRKIALIFQQAMLFPHMNVEQNLLYAKKWGKLEQEKFQLKEIAELLEIDHLLQRRVQQLSGGEAQRISIGRALLSSPKLLLLDEPLTGLDTKLKQQILPFFTRIRDEIQVPMIYVTHHHEELEQLDAEIIELQDHQLSNSPILSLKQSTMIRLIR